MILKQVHLAPFAGISDVELKFRKGLNVILGPNEAGKSTIFHAVSRGLFLPSKLYKKDFERHIQDYIPHSGDTAAVKVKFAVGPDTYTLFRRWGPSSHVQLTQPDGSTITDDKAVAEIISQLLPVQQGTVNTVLLTCQSGLAATLDALKKNNRLTVNSLSDILMKTLLSTDGVSVDSFRQALDKKHMEAYNNWDRERNSPNNNRGINNPHKKNVGKILTAYYQVERICQEHAEAVQFENQLDTINRQIIEYESVLKETSSFLNRNDALVRDLQEHEKIDKNIEILERDIKECKKAAGEWPVLEKDLETSREKLPALNTLLKSLGNELRNAKTALQGKELKQQYERAKKLTDRFETVQKELAALLPLDDRELAEIQKTAARAAHLKTSISAGTLETHLHAKEPLSISVQKDFDKSVEEKLGARQNLRIQAGGRIIIDHDSWSLEILSGAGDFSKVQKDLETAEKKLTGMLEKFKTSSSEEALVLNRTYEKKKLELDSARRNLADELGKETFKSISTKVKKLENLKGADRTPEEIVREQTKAENSRDNLEKKILECQKKADEYLAQYGSGDKLFERLGSLQAQKTKLSGQKASLTPIPAHIKNIREFIRKFDETRTQLQNTRDAMNRAKLSRAEITGRMPELSVEELSRLLEDAREQLEEEQKRGAAIDTIIDATEKELGTIDQNMFQSLEVKIMEYARQITDNRYTGTILSEGVPEKFVRDDGKSFNYNLLSTGTKDVFALIIRLAMADYFLDGAEGFLMMDDPLVDLDPVRQEKSAALIKEYADRKQVILFTCHPSHANILGGNIIELKERL